MATSADQPGWTLSPSLLPSLAYVRPLIGDHQGGTTVSIFGAGFAFNGTDATQMVNYILAPIPTHEIAIETDRACSRCSQRCCWDHHAGYVRERSIGSPVAFPERSISLLTGGDGVADMESAVDSVNDSVVVCRSYTQVPGYTHTDDLLLSFAPSCHPGALMDTRADFTFILDARAMQLVDVVPWGGPLLGGTPVTIRATDLGGERHRLRCRFGREHVEATYVDRTTLRCVTPWVGEAIRVALEVTPDAGDTWTLPLNFTFYETRVPRISAVWPLGGPDVGGGVITVFGNGFADYRGRGGGLHVGLGVGSRAHWLRTHVLNASALLAWTVNVTNASAIRGERIVLEGGGFDDGGTRGVAPGGETVWVTLNGDLRDAADVVRGVNVTYRFYRRDELRVSQIFPYGGHHEGGTELTLHGAGFLDLGRPLCLFGYASSTRGALPLDPASGDGNTPWWNASAAVELSTPATILGPHEARCTSPRVANFPAETVPVELVLNGDRATKTDDAHSFAIYGQPGAELIVSAITPQGAPVSGGTLLTLHGSGMLDLGDVRVRFGRYGAVQARVDASGRNFTCITPPMLRAGDEPLAVTPDGATYTRAGLALRVFNARSIAISKLTPRGGPTNGGTRVVVRGARLASLPASCIFRGAAAPFSDALVTASMLNSTHAVCSSPQFAANGSMIVRVQMTLNGELSEPRLSRGMPVFEYFDDSAVVISSIAPLGGPTEGGTLVTLRGSGYVDRGGVFCRFGEDANVSAVPATLVSSSELRCLSPASPHLGVLRDVIGGSVRLALALNGDHAAYTAMASNVSFEYYLAAPGVEAVQVSLVLPVAGPSAGGSLLNVSGQGFAFLGGIFCRFGVEDRVVPATLVSASMMLCRSPVTTSPVAGLVSEYGQLEMVQVTLNAQQYTSSAASFYAFDQTRVRVSSLVPRGGPMAGGTEVTVLGSGFVEHNAHCTIGGAGNSSLRMLVRATVVNVSAIRCMAPSRESAAAEAVEVTLNGDVSANSMTSDGVTFDFLNMSGVTISSIAPLGGPTEGGTLVTLRGSGYVDRGGVFCQFGSDPSLVSPATLVSGSELTCITPPRPDSPLPVDTPLRYALVHSMASCCIDPIHTIRLGSSNGVAATPSDCEAGCTSLAACRFFSHSLTELRCDYCTDCAFESATDRSAHFTSWQRLGPTRTDVRVRLVINGVADVRLPAVVLAPAFTYYLPQSLVLSATLPVGGPVAGGTTVTVHGIGFGPLTASSTAGPRCAFGELGPVDASIAADHASLRCTSPIQPVGDSSLLSVRSVTDGTTLPPVPRARIAHRWTTDGCSSAGALHANHCTPIDTGRAAIMCCALDGSRCQSMCVSPVDAAGRRVDPDRGRYPLSHTGGLTGSFSPLSEAEAVCDELMMRLCTLRELSDGLCCDGGCAFDEARVWSADDCTSDSEHTPIDVLALRADLLRVSINGQQYSAGYPHFNAPARPHPWSDLATPVPGFTYYDAARHVTLSAVFPSEGPVAGGTLVTLTGLGFADLGARVGFFSEVDGTSTNSTVAATLAFGAFRGRVLTCRTPPSATNAAGAVRLELSLNGEPLPPAMTDGSLLRFLYRTEEDSSGDAASGEAASG